MSFSYSTIAIEKWKLHDFMAIVDSFESDFVDKVSGMNLPCEENYHTILLNIVGKAILTTRELLTLCAHGYPDGALSLARNLYEQMILVTYFNKHKKDSDFADIVKAYFKDYDVRRYKLLSSFHTTIGKDDEYTRSIEDSLNTIKSETGNKLKNDYWWANQNSFAEMALSFIHSETDDSYKVFLATLHATYKQASLSLHASCIGNAARLGTDSGLWTIDTSPTLNGFGAPLWFAAASLIPVIGTLCHEFGVDYQKTKTLSIIWQYSIAKVKRAKRNQRLDALSSLHQLILA